ncbi:hypothetical protein [Segatella copri]|uniref:Major fimbrial subunit protein N-terminal domain-containing protein n=1 Tax=Segatella copri TaxID=165179 RepID=A0AA92U7H6_9BACT|nr:hypothetical protein [Segatella copri]RGW77416.1 hypothetical protein DWV53_10845 [Segatella copri]
MFLALAASSLLFSACSSDDAVVSTVGQNEAVQQIVLQVASSGDGLSTRAGRPLYSSEALQTIQHVRVLIYNTKTNAIVKDEQLDWTKSDKYDNHGRQHTLTYKGDKRLEGGSYKVMAVGYSENSDYTYSLDVTGASLTGKTYSDITATLKEGKKDAEEVFAGDADLKIGVDKNITNFTSGEKNGVAVTLHRQVAGSFGYFSNIPAKVGEKTAATLRLVVRDKNDKLTFDNFNSSFTANGATGSTIKYYVNGSTSTGAALATTDKFSNGDNGYVLYSIDLKKWFPQLDENGDGVLNAQDASWKRPDDVKTQVVKGSVFGSNFVIPFALTHEKSTMELQLLDEHETIIKKWTVSIPELDVNKDDTKGAIDESASIFNVVRNHMYNLGVKTSTGTTTTPDPSNPTPDPDPDPKPTPDPGKDEPEDLTKSQNLILKVNDNWEAIHKMELGD